ncbi:MAG: M15 family metallopeptidase [Oscillospiraceae bacterium]|nr:M15 family metallopeptidase [Oscillospiraceae bacterium]
MRLKPKDPKKQKLRRVIVGGVAACAVIGLLFYSRDSGISPEDLGGSQPDAAVAGPFGEEQIPGELDWEYPEGWVDYSDLPASETLGDDTTRGLSNWRYLLVNGLDRTNYLRASYVPDMTIIENNYFQTRAADDLRAFLAAARDAGYTVHISRSYLSYADQRTRFNGLASTLYDRGEMSLAEAEEYYTARGYFPGADEHQTGLAVNFVDENGEAKFSTPVLEWMTEHCAEYGFILRFPEGREAYTGHAAEPGHYRYVGQLAAEYIMRKGITLEEFKAAYDNEGKVTFAW